MANKIKQGLRAVGSYLSRGFQRFLDHQNEQCRAEGRAISDRLEKQRLYGLFLDGKIQVSHLNRVYKDFSLREKSLVDCVRISGRTYRE